MLSQPSLGHPLGKNNIPVLGCTGVADTQAEEQASYPHKASLQMMLYEMDHSGLVRSFRKLKDLPLLGVYAHEP
jgi:hypothetical protein|tara:strand:+ start:181 stop:402 length:222 start_codon:yes stop_codon:yes gene_type:complete